MTNKISYSKIPEFERDFKRLGKRFKTLDKDFELMKKMLLEPHFISGVPVPPKALVDIEGFCLNQFRHFICEDCVRSDVSNYVNCSICKIQHKYLLQDY